MTRSSRTRTADRGISTIGTCLILLALILVFCLVIPGIQRAHHRGRAMQIVNKVRALTDSLWRYNLDTGGWPRGLIWGQVPSDLEPYLPIDTRFDDPDLRTTYALTNYSQKSDDWIRMQGFQVSLRVRVTDVNLAQMIGSAAPNLFSRKRINHRGGSFMVILE